MQSSRSRVLGCGRIRCLAGTELACQKVVVTFHDERIGLVDTLLDGAVFAHHTQSGEDVFGLSKSALEATPNQFYEVTRQCVRVFAFVLGLRSISVIEGCRKGENPSGGCFR